MDLSLVLRHDGPSDGKILRVAKLEDRVPGSASFRPATDNAVCLVLRVLEYMCTSSRSSLNMLWISGLGDGATKLP